MMRILRQYLLLIWKNFLQQKRNLFWTCMEIGLLPVFPILLLAVVRTTAPIVVVTNSTTWPAFTVDDTFPRSLNPPLCEGTAEDFKLLYSPNATAGMDSMMNNVKERFSSRTGIGTEIDEVRGFDSESDLEAYMDTLDSCERTQILAAIVADPGMFDPSGEPWVQFEYKIRMLSEKRISSLGVTPLLDWNTDISYPGFHLVGPRMDEQVEGGLPGYYGQGFLALQRAVDFAYMIYKNNGLESVLDDVQINLQRYPYPPHTTDVFNQLLGTQLPLLIMFSYFLVVTNLTKDICVEKEKRQREFMRMYGMSTLSDGAAKFTRYIVVYGLGAALATLFMYVPTTKGVAMVNYTDASVFFVLTLTYSVSLIAVDFAISAFCNSGVTGGAVTGVFHLLTYVPFFYVQFHLPRLSAPWRAFTSIFPNMAMGYAYSIIAIREGQGVGVQWSNIGIPTLPEYNFSCLHAMLMMVLATILFSLIAWYFDVVGRRDHGVPKPFYYPLSTQLWCSGSNKKKNKGISAFNYEGSHFENVSLRGKSPRIQTRHLKKKKVPTATLR